MKRLVLKLEVFSISSIEPPDEWEKEDIEKIVALCLTQGYVIDLNTAYDAWWKHSDDYCASWLAVGDPKRDLDEILKYTDVVEIPDGEIKEAV